MGKIIKIDEAKKKIQEKMKKARREAGIIEELNLLAREIVFLPSVGGYWSDEDVSILVSPLLEDEGRFKVCVTLTALQWDLRGIRITLKEIGENASYAKITNVLWQAVFSDLPQGRYKIKIADE